MVIRRKFRVGKDGLFVERTDYLLDTYIVSITGFGRLFSAITSSIVVFILVYLIYPEGAWLIALMYAAITCLNNSLEYYWKLTELIWTRQFQIKVSERLIRLSKNEIKKLEEVKKELVIEMLRLRAQAELEETT